MQVEEALIRLGDRPIKKSPFSNVLVAVINGYFRRSGDEMIDMETPGDIALSRIYELNISDRVLRHEVGTIRDRDSYRTSLTVFSAAIVMIVMVVAVVEIANAETDQNGISFELFSHVLNVSLGALEKVISK